MSEAKQEETKKEYTDYENRSVVYVLELEDNYWYVGRSKHLQRRLERHQNGLGNSASWIFHHKVVGLNKIYELNDEKGNSVDMDPFMEDAITFRLMKEHGVDIVREEITVA